MKHNHLIGRLSVRILINLFILLLALNFLATAAQARPSPAVHKLDGTYLKKLVKDTGLVLSSPGRWEKTDWLKFGLCLASTSAFLPLDNSIHRQVYEHDSRALTSASKVFSAVGAPVSLVGLISAGYLFGHFQNSDSTRETFLLAGESLLITELLVQAGKISIGRARPYTLEGAFSFHPLTLQKRWQSFPSGHSAAAWAVAATLAGRVKSPGLRAVIYAMASGISLSRIFLDKHFASDVVAAALLGYFIGRKISQPELMGSKARRASININLGCRFMAFSLSYQF